MDYNKIEKYLEKFRKIIFKKEETHKIIVEVILKHTSSLLDFNLIKIKNTTIYVQSSPIIKNEILIHKEYILSDLKKLIPNQRIKDIK